MFIKRLKGISQSADSDLRLTLITADTIFARFKGLMVKRGLPANHALLLTQCNWIHSMFVFFSIDAVFLNREMTVVAIKHIKPFSLSMPVKRGYHVLEIKAGLSEQFHIIAGDRFVIDG